jgi:hypothetical protein
MSLENRIAELERRADAADFTVSFQACELAYLTDQLRGRLWTRDFSIAGRTRNGTGN